MFNSSETANLLLSTLSGSIVGVGDAIGEFDRTNLLRVVRADGVIIKPDDPIVPLDSTYIEQANDPRAPIVAAARTRHESSITSYVFAFAQGTQEGTEEQSEAPIATFSPATLGYDGPVYAYNYFENHGAYLAPLQPISTGVPDAGGYWIVVPVGASGIGFLGEEGKFISNGRNRISQIRDAGHRTVAETMNHVWNAPVDLGRLHAAARAEKRSTIQLKLTID